MPLSAWSVLAYAGALIVALSAPLGAQLLVGAAALVAAIVCAVRSCSVAALVCAVAAGASLTAATVRSADRQCANRLVGAREWQATFERDARPGEIARVAVSDTTCDAPATLLVAQGMARAGQRATIRGSATADPRGIVISDAVLSAVRDGPRMPRLRAATGRRIDRIFATDAPMARALVIADMSGIAAEERDRYARSGLVHMLSVSGLHVGIVALALELLASVLRLPRTPARIGTLLLLAVYVAAIGAPAPAVRAAVMLGALLVTRLAQRPTSPWAILALGAAAPLWNPHTVLDLGWQLSVVGTAALIAGGALGRRTIPRKWRGARRSLAMAAIVSVVATLVTAPLVAWAFGRIALLGPVTNLVADPVMGLLQPVLFLALAIPIGGVEQVCADAAHVLLGAFDRIAVVASGAQWAAPAALPTDVGACAAGIASVAVIVACMSRHPLRPLLGCACALAFMMYEPLLRPMRAAPELHMIDVGQGDALALRTERGRWIVIDAGRSWVGGDAGRSTVVPYLARRGGEVALFVLSHPHADHVGGAASLFALLPPRRFLDPGYVGTTAPYRAALAAARDGHIPWQRVRPGDSLRVDDIVVTSLAPDSVWASSLTDANLASTVLVARIGGVRVLFTGDAEAAEEDWLLAHAGEALQADVLKIAHHGSATSSTPEFLRAVNPRIALVSVGAHNTYGHPSAGVMAALHNAKVSVLRTDRLGSVVLRFEAGHIEVRAGDATWAVPQRDTQHLLPDD